MEFDRKDINMNKLVATSLEGKFHVFDMRTQHLTKGFASVSEKVIDLGGESQMDVWHSYRGKKIQSLLPLLLLLHVYSTEEKWGHTSFSPFSQLEVFGVVFV